MTLPLHLILVAAGSSRRFGGGDKLLADLNGAPVFVHALRRLTPVVTGKSVIVIPKGRKAEFENIAFRSRSAGKTRGGYGVEKRRKNTRLDC